MENENIKLIKNICNNHNPLDKEGFFDTFIDDIKVFKVSRPIQMIDLSYNIGVLFLVDGQKYGYMGDEIVLNTPEKYLMITAPQPSECGINAYKEVSLIGLYINFDLTRLQKVVSKLNELSSENFSKKGKLNSAALCEKSLDIENVFTRILKALQSEVESKMLEDELLNELYFRMLQDKYGFMLQELCAQNSSFSRISKVVKLIHSKMEHKISIDEMARLADMSSTSFHKLFKEALNDTPVQYIKKVRLEKARQLILHENNKAVEASQKVGYDSPTQFNREFKRYFGITPSKIKELK